MEYEVELYEVPRIDPETSAIRTDMAPRYAWNINQYYTRHNIRVKEHAFFFQADDPFDTRDEAIRDAVYYLEAEGLYG